MTLLEVAKHALEAMEDAMYRADTHEFYDAKESLRYAIEQAEQAEQEPDGISWLKRDSGYFTAPTPRKPDLEALNAELVEALRWCIRQMPEPVLPGDYTDGYKKARAALAKAQGESNG